MKSAMTIDKLTNMEIVDAQVLVGFRSRLSVASAEGGLSGRPTFDDDVVLAVWESVEFTIGLVQLAGVTGAES